MVGVSRLYLNGVTIIYDALGKQGRGTRGRGRGEGGAELVWSRYLDFHKQQVAISIHCFRQNIIKLFDICSLRVVSEKSILIKADGSVHFLAGSLNRPLSVDDFFLLTS